MSQVVWLPEALQDVERLRSFLQDKNPAAAARASRVLQDGAQTLGNYPDIGRPINDGTNRRELFLPFGAGSYVLRYINNGKITAIVRAWHSKEQRT